MIYSVNWTQELFLPSRQCLLKTLDFLTSEKLQMLLIARSSVECKGRCQGWWGGVGGGSTGLVGWVSEFQPQRQLSGCGCVTVAQTQTLRAPLSTAVGGEQQRS